MLFFTPISELMNSLPWSVNGPIGDGAVATPMPHVHSPPPGRHGVIEYILSINIIDIGCPKASSCNEVWPGYICNHSTGKTPVYQVFRFVNGNRLFAIIGGINIKPAIIAVNHRWVGKVFVFHRVGILPEANDICQQHPCCKQPLLRIMMFHCIG